MKKPSKCYIYYGMCYYDCISKHLMKSWTTLKNPLEILLTKKRLAMNASVISNFFKAIDPYKKDNIIQIKLWKIWVC
jgi:hypothetical protein